MRLSFKQKIVASFVVIGIVPMAVLAGINLKALSDNANELVGRSMKLEATELGSRVDAYLDEAKKQVTDAATGMLVREGLKELSAGVQAFDPAQVKVDDGKLRTYYENVKTKLVAAGDTMDVDRWMPTDPKAKALQYLYVAANSNSEHEELDDAGDGSAYSKVHAQYNRKFRDKVDNYGYYDFFLVDASGLVVFSHDKEIDYMSNVRQGAFADSDLANVVRKALDSHDKNEAFFSDIKKYAPSNDDLALFVAAPIIDEGKTIGAVAIQLPIAKLAGLFEGAKNIGETSDAFVMGADYIVRTQPMRLKMNIGYEFTGVLREAFKKVVEEDYAEVFNYVGLDGNTTVTVARPIDVYGLNWHVVVRVAQSEIMASVYRSIMLVVGMVVLTGLLTIVAGLFMSHMLTAPVQKLARGFFSGAEKVGRATGQVGEAVSSMVAASEETSAQSKVIRKNSSEASGYVNSVSVAVNELNTSIHDISQSIGETNVLIDDAVGKAQKTDEVVRSLGEASKKITEVVSLINDLAEQTNLLALNAAIEAARAGDAGRGFAVVADEVKKLASNTSQATVDIKEQVKEIQDVSEQSVVALQAVVEAIHRIRDNATAVSAAVEEQSGVAKQIAGSVKDASHRVQQVDDNMTGIEQAANDTGVAADQVNGSSGEVQTAFSEMKAQVQTVLDEMGIKA